MNVSMFAVPSAPILSSLPLQDRGTRRRRAVFTRHRPRSTNLVLTQKQKCHGHRRINHVQPFNTIVAPRSIGRQLVSKLGPNMTEDGHHEPIPNKDKEESSLIPTKWIRENRSSRILKNEHIHETNVVCCEISNAITPMIYGQLRSNQLEEVSNIVPKISTQTILKSRGAQTSDKILYRLRVFPNLKDIVDEEKKTIISKKQSRIFRYFRFLGRITLCQFSLTWLLTLWAILGAGAFYITENPRECQQVIELKNMQRDLAVALSTELRQLRTNDKETELLWSNKVRQYVARHEKLLLVAVSSGYVEGGDNGQLWTLPGCVLFAVSVLTTLGFGAPVPRTNAGRTVAVLFAAIGIPAHFLLMLNFGLLIAIALKRYGISRKYPLESRDSITIDSIRMPTWTKISPFIAIGVYYIFGILSFGAARLKPFSESLLFPLEFTAAGGLSTIAGYVRILYSIYLEGAVTLAAITVAVLKVSATQNLTNIGLKYGLLIPA